MNIVELEPSSAGLVGDEKKVKKSLKKIVSKKKIDKQQKQDYFNVIP